jgi:hypothetical protein
MTRITCRAKDDVCATINWKRFSSTGTSLQLVFAMAVALRGALSIIALSPTMAPAESVFEGLTPSLKFKFPGQHDVHHVTRLPLCEDCGAGRVVGGVLEFWKMLARFLGFLIARGEVPKKDAA